MAVLRELHSAVWNITINRYGSQTDHSFLLPCVLSYFGPSWSHISVPAIEFMSGRKGARQCWPWSPLPFTEWPWACSYLPPLEMGKLVATSQAVWGLTESRLVGGGCHHSPSISLTPPGLPCPLYLPLWLPASLLQNTIFVTSLFCSKNLSESSNFACRSNHRVYKDLAVSVHNGERL